MTKFSKPANTDQNNDAASSKQSRELRISRPIPQKQKAAAQVKETQEKELDDGYASKDVGSRVAQANDNGLTGSKT